MEEIIIITAQEKWKRLLINLNTVYTQLEPGALILIY